MPRTVRFGLLTLILFTCILVIARLSHYQAYFAQRNAATYVVKIFAIFIAYTIAILLTGRLKVIFGIGVLRVALISGLAAGLLEILTIAGENNALAFRVPPLLGLLSVFAIWDVAGFWATFVLNSIKAALSASVASAALCMLIGVFGGVLIEMFVAPTNPGIVATWQEFKRSTWTDPEAFQIANTLDSAFGHLLLAPIVGLVFGTLGSGLCRLLCGQKFGLTPEAEQSEDRNS